MEHLHHFGLSEDPFRNEPRMRDYFDTTASRPALQRLERALRQSKGLLVLAGESGSGKTMVLRRLLETLEEDVFEAGMLVVLKGKADADWMLGRFAKQMGVEQPAEDREARLAQVYEQLAIIREDGKHAVLLIDDADALAERETLAEVCGLLKLEYEERRLFSLVLAGGAALEAAIAADPLLAHRVEVKVRLEAFDLRGSTSYLGTRVRQAGGVPAIFDEAAVRALHELSQGLPGRLNILADNALFEAFLKGRERVGSDDVEQSFRGLGAVTTASAPPAETTATEADETRPEAPPGVAARTMRAATRVEIRREPQRAPGLDSMQALAQDLGDLDADLDAVFAAPPAAGFRRAERATEPPVRNAEPAEELLVELIED